MPCSKPMQHYGRQEGALGRLEAVRLNSFKGPPGWWTYRPDAPLTMRGPWTLRLPIGGVRGVIGFALWRNGLLKNGLLRNVGLAGQPTGFTPLSRCRDFGISDFESGLRGRYCALLFGAIGCSCLGCFDWLSRLLNPQARRLPRHSGTPRRSRFDKFIRRMNLPGLTGHAPRISRHSGTPSRFVLRLSSDLLPVLDEFTFSKSVRMPGTSRRGYKSDCTLVL